MSNKYRITFIIGEMDCGGAQRVLSLLANDWAQQGYEISILTFSGDKSYYELDNRINFKPLELHSTNHSRALKFAHRVYLLGVLKKSLKNTKPDIVISFLTKNNLVAIMMAKLCRVPIIASERNNYKALKKKAIIKLRDHIYPLADALTIQSEKDIKFYKKSKTTVIHNPVSFPVLSSVKKNTILCVGRLIRRKGFNALLENIKPVFENNPDWALKIVGDGNQRANLEQLIKDNHLEDNVILEGEKDNVIDYYSEASIFVLSSEFEGFPNVVLEAMSQGCAVIAYDCYTGPSDIVSDGQNGILIDDQDISGMVNAIDSLVIDTERRKYIQSNAIKRVSDFNINLISQQWLELINKIINPNNSGGQE